MYYVISTQNYAHAHAVCTRPSSSPRAEGLGTRLHTDMTSSQICCVSLVSAVTPEEKVNEKHLRLQMKHMTTRLMLEVRKDLRDQGTETYKQLQSYVTMQDFENQACKRHVQRARNTDEVLDALISHGIISHTKTSMLIEMAQLYCRQTPQIQANCFEKMRGFEELRVVLISELEHTVPLHQLLFCIMCTPLLCGASSYYRSIRRLRDTASVIRRIYLSYNPRLLTQVIRQFSQTDYTQRVQDYDRFTGNISPSLTPEEKALLEYQDEYASIVVTLIRRVDGELLDNHILTSNLPLSHEPLNYIPIFPLFHYQQPKLLIDVLSVLIQRKIKENMKVVLKETLQELKAYDEDWKVFSESTKLAAVMDTQMNEYPIDFPHEDKVIVTFHKSGEECKDLTISRQIDLAEATSDEFGMQLGSISPYRTVITHGETAAKGYCKIELVAPTKALCILIRASPSKKGFYLSHSIKHIECRSAEKYYFSHPVDALDLLHKQAMQHPHLCGQFQQLHSATLPHRIHQPNDNLLLMYSVCTSVLVLTWIVYCITHVHL